jgi:virulence factor Mce-like protein
MTRRPAGSIAANPVLIGAATVLVVLVAVFLSYNANSGLPFVPTYDVSVEVPSAANLVKGNDVRIGGTRVGAVTGITPQTQPDGTVIAVLDLQLEQAAGPLPADSTVLIRPRSALGLKYVQLTRGTSSRTLPAGSTLPLSQARPEPVELDEVLGTFDEPTRKAQAQVITEFGDALAGRGVALNPAVEQLPDLLTTLTPVARTLADRRTALGASVRALSGLASEVAPVAESQAGLLRAMDTTFGALASVAPSLRESLRTGPPALQAVTQELPAQRPFLANATALFSELRPGFRALGGAADDLAGALEVGTPVLRRSQALSRRLEPTLRELERFANDQAVVVGVDDLTALSSSLRPTVAHLKPAQTVCNYVTLFFRNAASLLSEGDANGTGQRFIIIAPPQGPNNEGSPSSAPANGPGDNFLHTNPYPNTASPGQPRECEAGNEPFLTGRQVLSNPPGTQSATTDRTKR